MLLKFQTVAQVDTEMSCGWGNMSPQMVRLCAPLRDLRDGFETTRALDYGKSANALNHLKSTDRH
jgi:hypothetical protein